MADLGRWLSEDYRVPDAAQADADRDPDADAEPGTRGTDD
jgi:endogenous inhibitor of DNA gyrase (YacG/DUF329 family)